MPVRPSRRYIREGGGVVLIRRYIGEEGCFNQTGVRCSLLSTVLLGILYIYYEQSTRQLEISHGMLVKTLQQTDLLHKN